MKQPMFFIYVVIDITGMPISGNGFYIPKEKSPSVCHLSNTDAIKEAERLAEKHPGRTFAVFHSGMAVTSKIQKAKVHLLSKSQFKPKKKECEP